MGYKAKYIKNPEAAASGFLFLALLLQYDF